MYQRLTLHRDVLSFHYKNKSNKQNYIALSYICFINYIIFESRFFYNCFPSQPLIGAKNRIVNVLNKNSQQIPIFMVIQLLVVLLDSDLINGVLVFIIIL